MNDTRAGAGGAPVIALSFMITLGFFAVLGVQIYRGVNHDMMIGALIAAFTGVVGYHFGTSSSSAKKDETIRGLTETAAAVATTAQAAQAAADPPGPGTVGRMDIAADTVNVNKGKP